LAEHLPITRQAVSKHLRVLKDGGLVVATPDGTRRIYRLNPDGVAGFQAYFQRIWDDALSAFQKAADAASTEPEQEQQK
jgi:DNA-binding transcriptional ArsR family regulator